MGSSHVKVYPSLHEGHLGIPTNYTMFQKQTNHGSLILRSDQESSKVSVHTFP